MLDNWFEYKLDYLNLWYGAIFFLLAILAYMLQTNQRSNSKAFLYWNKFGWFSILYGSSIWLSDLFVSLRDIKLLNFGGLFLYLSSLYLFYLFSYHSSKYQDIKIIFNKKFIITLVIIGLIAGFFNIYYLVFTIAIAFGLPAIIQSISLFKGLAKKCPENSKDFHFISIFLGAFAFFKISLMIRVYLLSGSYPNQDAIINRLYALFYYLVVISSFLFIFNIWHYAKQIIKEHNVILKGYYLPTACVLSFVAGLGLIEWRSSLVEANIRDTMLRMTLSLSRTLDTKDLNSLTYTDSDENEPVYKMFCKQFNLLKKGFELEVSGIYILKKINNQYAFGPQSDLKIDKNYVKSGSIYNYNINILDEVYNSGVSKVYGPYSDNFGNFITAYLPLFDNSDSSKVTNIIALDIDSKNWKLAIERARAKIIIGMMILIGLPIIALTIMIYQKKQGYNTENTNIIPYFTMVYGLTISVLLAMFVNRINIVKKQQDFIKQAEYNSFYISEYFRDLRMSLNYSKNYLSRRNGFPNYEEFVFFAKNYSYGNNKENWKWLDVVQPDQLEQYESSVRQEKHLENFKVREYQNSANKNSGKNQKSYIPLRYVYPEDKSSKNIGIDYNSETISANILDYVTQTGLLYAYCKQDFSSNFIKNYISIFIPIQSKETGDVTHFLIQIMPLQEIIEEIIFYRNNMKDGIELELVDLEQDKGINILAKYPKNNSFNKYLTNNKDKYSFTTPIFVFGRTLAVKLYPSEEYDKNNHGRIGFLAVMLAGIILTGLIVIFVTFLQKNQVSLEKLVEERTKEVTKRENLLKTISDNLPIVSYRCTPDENRKFTFLSSEIINLCGIAPSDFLIGEKTYNDVIYPNDIEFVKKSIEEASNNHKHFDIEYRLIGRNKKIIWVNERGHMAFDQDNNPIWIDGTIADVTARKEASAKLNESLYELEKANAELKLQTEKASQYAEEAKNANETKSRFLASMSHEIRTPMNAIIGMSDLLKETNLSSTQRRYTDIICSSSENLLALINDVLDFSKMEAGKMNLENISFSLSDCINDVVKMLILKASEKKLFLNYNIDNDVPLYLKGDPYRLRQVLVNLVNNAIKFTNKGGINIKVRFIQNYEDDVLLKFSVSDTGIGIERKNIGKLFNIFVQADGSTARKYGGSGLGLAISKQIVNLFHGQIGVESEFGKGSDFWFTARFSIEREEENIESIKEKQDTVRAISMDEKTRASKKLLLVEDNEINQQVSVALLEKLGFKADIAQNGNDAIKMLSKKQYDLVFMDCQMPVLDGFETSKKIRNGEAGSINSEVIIIALTANVLASDRKRCIEAGMNDYICKPVQSSYLLAKLEKWLNNNHSDSNNDLSLNDNLPIVENTSEINEQKTESASSKIEKNTSPENDNIAPCLKGIDNSVINCEELTKRLLNDESLIRNIIKTFNNVAPGIIETLRFAVEAENYDLAKEQAHSLKGSAATISAISLEKIASELESYYINSEYGRAPECFQRLEKEYNKVQKEIF